MSTNFQKALHQLNQQQLKAVNAIEGPVMVIAGPGTGKTQVLTLRIANILSKTDTAPQNIIALTFTDSAAHNMRSRLLQFAGSVAYKVNITTFHSFVSSLIQEYPDYFSHLPFNQVADDITRIQVFEKILDKHDFDLLKPINEPHYYLPAILSAVSTLKREGVSPAALSTILKKKFEDLQFQHTQISKTKFVTQEKQILKNLELLQIYKKYQHQLQTLNCYDYEDMINWIRDALLQNTDFATLIQERFQYLLIDEYQDTNNSQNQIAALLASFWGQNANIFVVGDDEQAIFRFQGASIENTLNFTKSYPTAQIITLTNNYRSQQTILDASRSLISNNKITLQRFIPAIDRSLISQVSLPSKKIKIISCPSQLEENAFLVKKIKTLLKNKVVAQEIAVMVRNNADLFVISDVLSHANIDHHIEGGNNVLQSLSVSYLLTLFEVIYKMRNNQENPHLFTLLNYPFTDLDAFSILKLSRSAGQKKLSLIDIPLDTDPKIKDCINILVELNKEETSNTFIKFAENAIKKSGLLEWVLKQDDTSLLTDLNAFFDFIKNIQRSNPNLHLSEFLQNITTLQKNNLKIPTPDNIISSGKVILTTAHKAKGKEWDYCFIANCINGKWGGQTVRNLITLPVEIIDNYLEHDPIEDERRLFYVALTRARRQVYISFALSYPSQGKSRQTLPSQFIEEIPLQFKQVKKIKISLSHSLSHISSNISPAPYKPSLTEKKFIDNILQDFRLSVTALNNYLECPYKFKLVNLYRIPTAKKTYLAFGTAIHSALESFYSTFASTSKLPSKNLLLSQFEVFLKKEILNHTEFAQRLKQGKSFLDKYIDFHQGSLKPPLFIEKHFGTRNSPLFFGQIPLTGKVDRIDLIDKSKNMVKVVDYKTGKRKTRGQIEGTTADQNGSLKRQLVFYKLLSDLDTGFPYAVAEAELDFIQFPFQAGKSGKEVFYITDKEVNNLKTTIKDVYQKIKNHQFEHTSDPSLCQNCEFKKHCEAIKATSQNTQEK